MVSYPQKRHALSLARSLTLCAALTLSAVLALGAPATAFSDVPRSHPYREAVDHLRDEGIVTGYPDGTFGPDGPAWRQHFAKMAVLTFDLPVSEADICPFGDVEVGGPSDLYPDNYVAVAAAEGLTRGRTSTRFDPYDDVTRAQAVTMVVRGLQNLHEGILEEAPVGYVSTWGDYSPDHGPTARAAEFNGLLTGLGRDAAHPDGDLRPLDPWAPMPRGELAQLLHNALTLLAGAEPPVPPTLEAVHDPDAAVDASYDGCSGGPVCHELNLLAEHTRRELSCEACHGQNAPPEAVAAIAAYAATGEKQGCFACHDMSAFHGDATVAHRASPAASCTDCHLIDLSAEHARASSSVSAEGCAACHPSPASFVWSGQCVACHADGAIAPPAHGASPGHPSPSAECGDGGCHPDSLVAIHTGSGGCTTCHSTAGVPASAACSECHAEGSFHGGFAGAHQVSATAGACAAAGCHQGTDLATIHAGDCATCHGETRPTSGECAGCHGAGPHVVPEPYRDSCDQCHSIGGPGAGLHDMHAVSRGFACSNCHSQALPSCVSAACHEHDTATIHGTGAHQDRPCTFCHTSGAPGHGPTPFRYGYAPSEFQQPCLTSGCHEHKGHMDQGDCLVCHGPGGTKDVHVVEDRHVRDRATCGICHDLGQNTFTACATCHSF